MNIVSINKIESNELMRFLRVFVAGTVVWLNWRPWFHNGLQNAEMRNKNDQNDLPSLWLNPIIINY